MSGHFGPLLHTDRGTLFRLWAPAASRVELLLSDASFAMADRGDGWYELPRSDAGAGSRYRFRIDGGLEIADPASHFQPEDVSGPSEVIDFSAYRWRCNDWRGRPWAEAVICELHVGAFTPGGTFRSAIEKLDHLAETGFTAIELMPIADFAGGWNWGYDGVQLFAPDHSYGRPSDLMALVDAAHERGLMVLLDVVYNHFGPKGNYLPRIAPQFFTEHRHTPWGTAIDYRVPQVREFAIQSALHWLDRYRLDGLRLDAVHAITEAGEPHILDELSRRVCDLARQRSRLIHLVLENDDNCAAWLGGDHTPGRFQAQWNDDYHHAWHVVLTGETHGYYVDYADRPRRHLARALAEGFVYQGEASPHRAMAVRGEDSTGLPPTAFVEFIQNHDQIGNRPEGDRLAAALSPDALGAALSVTLLAPAPVLLFMGEEWRSARPFPFFCDFHGDLAEAVRQGRRREFAAAYADPAAHIPDPLAETTFQSAKLDWDAIDQPDHAAWLTTVRRLLTIRRTEIVPHFANSADRMARADGDVVFAQWTGGGGRTLYLLVNAGEKVAACDPGWMCSGRSVWGGTPTARLAPWAVHCWIAGK